MSIYFEEMASGWAFKVINQLQGDQKPNNFKLGELQKLYINEHKIFITKDGLLKKKSA